MNDPIWMGSPTNLSAILTHDRVHVPTESSPTAQTKPGNGSTSAMRPNANDDASQRPADADIDKDTSLPTVERIQDDSRDEEELRPPLPPRPTLLKATSRPSTASSTTRPVLQSKPTTAISSVDIQTLSFPDGTRGTFSVPTSRSVSETVSVSGTSGGQDTPSRKISRNGSDLDDNASLISFAPTLNANGDLASLLDKGLSSQSPAWRLLSSQSDGVNAFENIEYEDTSLAGFDHEFDEVDAVDSKEGGNEGGFANSSVNSF
jgi:hypothetical protein